MDKEIKAHIAVSYKLKKRFDYLQKFLITKDKTQITHEDILEELLNSFEKLHNGE